MFGIIVWEGCMGCLGYMFGVGWIDFGLSGTFGTELSDSIGLGQGSS